MAGRPLGRFAITASTDDTKPPTPTSTPSLTNADETVIDLHPIPPATPAGERLPDRMLVVDDSTIAIAWTGRCNEPGSSVTVRSTADEVELRLTVARVVTVSCSETDDDWGATFDLPEPISARRVVARWAQGPDEVVASGVRPVGTEYPEPRLLGYGTSGSVGGDVQFGVTSFRVRWDDHVGKVVSAEPWTENHGGCPSGFFGVRWDVGGQQVYRLDMALDADPDVACDGWGITMFDTGPPPFAGS